MATLIRPFPLPIRIGTDICCVPRIYRILHSLRGPRFIRRLLAEEELARPKTHIARVLGKQEEGEREGERNDWGEKSRPWNFRGDASGEGPARDAAVWEAAVFMAGRLAAKEAAIKAHPHRRLTFHDIIIRNNGGGETATLGSGPPAALIKDEVGGGLQGALISISHDGDYATAVCVGFEMAHQ